MKPFMEMTLTTPAVLFPAISLLLLAYTNRFVALSALIRQLHADYQAAQDPGYLVQIAKMRKQIRLIRNMQFAGAFSLLLCTVCMFLLFCGWMLEAESAFALGLILMIYSLYLSMVEIQISTKALDLHLSDLERPAQERPPRP